MSLPSIAFVTASLSSQAGGLASTMPETLNALHGLGAPLQLHGLSDPALDEARLRAFPCPVTHAGSLPSPFLRPAPGLDRALGDGDPDLLHLQGIWLYPSIAALRWRRRTGRPVVISPHGMLDPWALRNAGWKKRIALRLYERRNLEGAACLHALNASEKAAFRAMGLANPVAVIPNGVQLPAPRNLPRPAILGDDPRRVLLFLGRIHPKKGVLETVEAWAQAIAARPALARDWRLVVAGWDDGGLLEEARARVAALGLAQHVLMPGAVFGDDKEALLQHADAFILASRSEGLPMGILEAWAHETPVFMTEACNIPEGFAAQAAVRITVAPGDIAAALSDRLNDPDLPELGRNGRRLVAERFGWPQVGADLLSVYRWVTGGGPRPDCVHLP